MDGAGEKTECNQGKDTHKHMRLREVTVPPLEPAPDGPGRSVLSLWKSLMRKSSTIFLVETQLHRPLTSPLSMIRGGGGLVLTGLTLEMKEGGMDLHGPREVQPEHTRVNDLRICRTGADR